MKPGEYDIVKVKKRKDGLKGAKERGIIPEKVFYEIFDCIGENHAR